MSNELLDLILSNSKEGFIGINKDGYIKLYNNKAKEIFGLKSSGKTEHSSGHLQNGDIIIIADNRVGADDGNLSFNDLETIGIYDNTIQHGDSLIAIGAYKDSSIEPHYRLLKSYDKRDSFSLHSYFQGFEVDVFMDFDRQRINIEVLGKNYYMDYYHSIGHMVVISARDSTIKFCQENGYTARKESVGELLRGKHFMSKGKNEPELETKDKFIFDIHEKNKIMEDFFNAAKGEECYFKNRYEEINGFPTYCSLSPVDDNHTGISALLRIEDVSQINQIIEEKNQLSQEININENLLKNRSAIRKLFPEVSGKSLAIQSLKRLAYLASQYNEPLLIHGEPGVGKSLFAKNIHKISPHSDGPFVHFHCNEIPYNEIEKSLFGHYESQLFLGAFELASGGTLYVDAIENLPLNVQKKLANAISNQYYNPKNSETQLPLTARIIASSSDNLEERVEDGSFDNSLFEQVQSLNIWIPPLSQRKEDIPMIIEDISNEIYKNNGVEQKKFTEEAIDYLVSYPWKENTKSIKSFLTELLTKDLNDEITFNVVEQYLPSQTTHNEDEDEMTLKEFLESKEKQFIISKLKKFNGDKRKTMDALGISKTSLYDKISKYGISEK